MHCGNSPGNKICKCNRTSLNHWSSHFWNCFAQICDMQVLWNSNCTNTRLTDATEEHWNSVKTREGWRASCRASCITSWNYVSYLSSWNKRGKHSLYFRSKYRVTVSDPTGKNFLKQLALHSADFLLGYIIPVPEWESKDPSLFWQFCLYLMLVYIGLHMGNQLLCSINLGKRVVVSWHNVKRFFSILLFSSMLPSSHFAIHSMHLLFLLYL